MWKKKTITVMWWLLAVGIGGLLMAGIQYKKQLPCSDIVVNIEKVQGHVFINENEIVALLQKNGVQIGAPTPTIPLQPLETLLKQQPWILNAELFFDNQQVLNVTILEREPLARIFTAQGSSFYIDSSGMHLPLSADYSARVPMFTRFPSGKKNLAGKDSLLMEEVKNIANIIQQDSFWLAQVAQVNITPQRTFEIIPVLGNQLIKLGNGDSLQSKFDRLTAFYRQVWAKGNFEKYETVSVEYDGQVIAVKRNTPAPPTDTTGAQRIINAMQQGKNIDSDPLSLLPADARLATAATDTSHPVAAAKTKTAPVQTNSQPKAQNTTAATAQKATPAPKKASVKSNKKASG